MAYTNPWLQREPLGLFNPPEIPMPPGPALGPSFGINPMSDAGTLQELQRGLSTSSPMSQQAIDAVTKAVLGYQKRAADQRRLQEVLPQNVEHAAPHKPSVWPAPQPASPPLLPGSPYAEENIGNKIAGLNPTAPAFDDSGYAMPRALGMAQPSGGDLLSNWWYRNFGGGSQ